MLLHRGIDGWKVLDKANAIPKVHTMAVDESHSSNHGLVVARRFNPDCRNGTSIHVDQNRAVAGIDAFRFGGRREQLGLRVEG
jgi:hypothetical protein